MRKNLFLIFLLILILTGLESCKQEKTQIHLQDRHGLSYKYIKNYAAKNGAVTLFLLDYHHDILPEVQTLTSVNWVGKLIEEDIVKEVFWLSGKKLLLPNRNSRMAWLERSLKNAYPATADKIRDAVTLVDWYDLQKIKSKEPFAVTLDMDVFTKDPGEDADLFVDEICTWIQKQNPELLTISFSAAYQPDPIKAWNWLNLFVKKYRKNAEWFLESGEFGEKEESFDELSSHEVWRKKSEIFKNHENAFYSGAYLWQNAPDYLILSLNEKHISPDNKTAEEIINDWNNPEIQSLKKKFDNEKLKEFSVLAKKTMKEFFEGSIFNAPNQNNLSKDTYGIAVRFRNFEEDRGCLSLYRGIDEKDIPSAVQYCTQEALVDPRYLRIRPEEEESLITNISIFSNWQEMKSCLDFEPGMHSLLLEDSDGEKTLLQTAIALERNYTREEFLSRLSNKAGLGFDGWKNENLKFYKSVTVTYSEYNPK